MQGPTRWLSCFIHPRTPAVQRAEGLFRVSGSEFLFGFTECNHTAPTFPTSHRLRQKDDLVTLSGKESSETSRRRQGHGALEA